LQRTDKTCVERACRTALVPSDLLVRLATSLKENQQFCFAVTGPLAGIQDGFFGRTIVGRMMVIGLPSYQGLGEQNPPTPQTEA